MHGVIASKILTDGQRYCNEPNRTITMYIVLYLKLLGHLNCYHCHTLQLFRDSRFQPLQSIDQLVADTLSFKYIIVAVKIG